MQKTEHHGCLSLCRCVLPWLNRLRQVHVDFERDSSPMLPRRETRTAHRSSLPTSTTIGWHIVSPKKRHQQRSRSTGDEDRNLLVIGCLNSVSSRGMNLCWPRQRPKRRRNRRRKRHIWIFVWRCAYTRSSCRTDPQAIREPHRRRPSLVGVRSFRAATDVTMYTTGKNRGSLCDWAEKRRNERGGEREK